MIHAEVLNSTGDRQIQIPAVIHDFKAAYEWASDFGQVRYLYNDETGEEREFELGSLTSDDSEDQELMFDWNGEQDGLIFMDPAHLEQLHERRMATRVARW